MVLLPVLGYIYYIWTYLWVNCQVSMKILFICSSIESGHSGVGDYTQRIAGEFIRQNHTSAIISLNDKYVNDEINSIRQIENNDIPVLRLPAKWPLKDRISLAKKYIDAFDPDWISLQFVVFGFHPKGLPFGLANKLKSISNGRKWHIMFHELWVGMVANSSKRHIFWGWLQKRIITDLVSKLKPKVVNTHTQVYQVMLKDVGIAAEYLKLISTITVVPSEESKKLLIDNTIKMVIFGATYPDAPIEKFAEEVAALSKKKKTNISLSIIGRSGKELIRWKEIWIAAGLEVEVLGEQSSENISKVLNNSSIGIATTPYILSEKSSSISAMTSHGLPVLCVSGSWTARRPIDFKDPEGITSYKQGQFENYIEELKYIPRFDTLSEMAIQMIKSFETYS